MSTPSSLDLRFFRLSPYDQRHLAPSPTRPASHRPHRYLRHRRPTRSNRRHAQIQIPTGPDVLPLIDLPDDRCGSRSRRAVPKQNSRLAVFSLADRLLLDIIACWVGRDVYADQVSRCESLLVSSRIGDSTVIRNAHM
jgi:hypothetical protein